MSPVVSSFDSPTAWRHLNQRLRPFPLLTFLLHTSHFFTTITATALFLQTYGVVGLPFIFMAAAVAIPLIYTFSRRLEQRYTVYQLLVAGLLIGGGTLALLMGLLAWVDGRWPTFLLMLWATAAPALIRQTTNRGAQWLQAEQTDTNAAPIMGAIVTAVFISFISVTNLLWLAIMAVCLAFLLTIHLASDRLERGQREAVVTAVPPLNNLFADNYTRLLAVTGVLAALTTVISHTLYFALAAVQFTEAAQWVLLLAVVWGMAELATWGGRTFITLTHTRIRRYLILPGIIAFLIVAAALIISQRTTQWLFPLLLIIGLKVSEEALRHPTETVAQTTLLQPLSLAQRRYIPAVRTFVIHPIATGLSGLLLWLIFTLFSPSPASLLWLTLGVIALWSVSNFLLTRAYPQRIFAALSQRHLLAENTELFLDEDNRNLLRQSLHSPHTAVVLYAMDTLAELDAAVLQAALPDLFSHPETAVRQQALAYVEQKQVVEVMTAVHQRLPHEPDTDIRSQLIRLLAALGQDDVPLQMLPYLQDPSPTIRQNAMIGLLRSGNLQAIIAAGQVLLEAVHSTQAEQRLFAAQVLAEVAIPSFYQLVRQLLDDDHMPVQQTAVRAAGTMQNPHLWSPVLALMAERPSISGVAVAALAGGGTAVLSHVASHLQTSQSRPYTLSLLKLCGRIGGTEAAHLLLHYVNFPQEAIREQALKSLIQTDYRAVGDAVLAVEQMIMQEIAQAIWLLAIWQDVHEAAQVDVLVEALVGVVTAVSDRLFYLLAFIYGQQHILEARDGLRVGHPSRQNQARQTLELMLPASQQPLLLPLLDTLPMSERWHHLQSASIQAHASLEERLALLIGGSPQLMSPWLRVCALYVVAQRATISLLPQVTAAQADADELVRETAVWAATRLNPPSPGANPLSLQGGGLGKGSGDKSRMLSTIEKIITLKAISIFADVPDKTLAQIAAILKETQVPAGKTIFAKGDLGNSLYIIVSGQIRVHDGEFVINHLGEHDLFGEMAVLDSAPRMASITAVTDTHLLQLNQEPLYELIESHTEIGRGIIQVLSRRLRQQTQELKEQQTSAPA
jgi:HEAT repeat protein